MSAGWLDGPDGDELAIAALLGLVLLGFAYDLVTAVIVLLNGYLLYLTLAPWR